jgi:uncharacterized membrane protein YphA (DoxX/SURF4 family)
VIERWRRWWFPEDSGFDLAVCRILVAGAQLFVFLPFFMATPSEHVALIERGTGFMEPQWLIGVLSAIVPRAAWPTLVQAAWALSVGAGIATVVGWKTRASALCFALSTWLLVSHAGSYGQIQHAEVVLSMFLLFLGLSPSGRHLSLDAKLRGPTTGTTDEAVWPLRLTQILLAWSYFSNAVAKLAHSGLEWLNGYTLQQHLLSMSMLWERPLGAWLARQHELCVALSLGTLAFELAFPLAVFVPRTRPFFLVGGVVFHLATYFTMNVVFIQHLVLYATFIDFEGLAARLRSRGPVALAVAGPMLELLGHPRDPDKPGTREPLLPRPPR